MEGKLTELGHELFGMQAILSDSDESVLYLVNEGGVIKKVDMAADVLGDDSHEQGAIEHSVLHDVSELERLCQTVNERERVIENL